ncbi:DUF6354 family protein [Streptomyces niveus]|uniref:DUF6354 family protein n=1 Tax=Streptomyces niveus TaxID=193462 RepID=UPI003624E9D6
MTTRPAVAEGQLYRDLAPDMKDRHRYLRVTAVTNAQATLLVENDLGGQVGRVTRASLTRLSGSAFELLGDPADTDPLYLKLLNAMSLVHGTKATSADYARAALHVTRRAAGSLTVQTFHSSIGGAMGAANKANADMAARIAVARAAEDASKAAYAPGDRVVFWAGRAGPPGRYARHRHRRIRRHRGRGGRPAGRRPPLQHGRHRTRPDHQQQRTQG